jgi:hypothetical protein
MRLPIENVLSVAPSSAPAVTKCADEINRSIELTRKIAIDNIKQQQEIYKANYDKNAKYPTFKIGDQVLLHTPTIKPGLNRKLVQKFSGPFYICDVNDNHTYIIRDGKTHQQHPSRVHANRLRAFVSPWNRLYNAHDTAANAEQQVDKQTDNDATTPLISPNTAASSDPHAAPSNNSSSSAPLSTQTTNGQDKLTNDTREWHDAERILSSRVRNRRRQYRVKWSDKNYPPSWTDANDVSAALVREFQIRRTQQRRRRRRRN